MSKPQPESGAPRRREGEVAEPESGAPPAASSQPKAEFLAHMSHELRTPLTAILGFSEVLADGSCGELTRLQAEYVRHILDSGHQLLDLVNDLLDLAELREPEIASVDLGTLALDAAAQVAALAAQRGVRVEVDVAPHLPPVAGEARQLQKAIFHLLRQALMVTPGGQCVRLEVRASTECAAGGAPCELVATVSDAGPGMPGEQLSRLFQPFAWAGSGGAPPQRSLSLALARRAMELHGGRIWAASDGTSGSSFHLAIPAAVGRHITTS